jgi:hypothetical protein
VVKEYLGKVSKLKEHLFTLIHISSGLPQCGTEVSETLFLNTGTAMHNIIAVGEHLCLLGTYNKTSHNTHSNLLLPQGIHPKVADILLSYMVLVQPVEALIASLIADVGQLGFYRHCLWAMLNGKWELKAFNAILTRAFSPFMNIVMTVGKWRHISHAIVHHPTSTSNPTSNSPSWRQSPTNRPVTLTRLTTGPKSRGSTTSPKGR